MPTIDAWQESLLITTKKLVRYLRFGFLENYDAFEASICSLGCNGTCRVNSPFATSCTRSVDEAVIAMA